MFKPTTFAHFAAIWPFLSFEQKEAYVAEGPVRRIIDATNNQRVLGSNYSLPDNRAAVRSVYIFGPDDEPEMILGTAHEYDYERIEGIDPGVTKQVLGAGIMLEPRIIPALVKVNGGTMPVILDPVIPPSQRPQPNPVDAPTETPVESSPEPETIVEP
ncbi:MULTISPECIES: hypothetical protein [unclassified Spirosoma]|uniref:hypothetical protein n=1 Tax=unclassified Spirosoma TaxID=2621999 RepID=UPI0009609A6D|nr:MULTISPECIES: hypothetical protein [unclassified Spirosoma]MBN8824435.1 hypothetical protein [Spirosoma sp.]OJW70102.1 MAG: hypothetical protein BGO59_25850 [Spirosoma sp. 48-14]